MAHKLQSGIKDSVNYFKEIKELNITIYKIISFFRDSSKRIRILNAIEETELNVDDHVQLILPLDVRWSHMKRQFQI